MAKVEDAEQAAKEAVAKAAAMRQSELERRRKDYFSGDDERGYRLKPGTLTEDELAIVQRLVDGKDPLKEQKATLKDDKALAETVKFVAEQFKELDAKF